LALTKSCLPAAESGSPMVLAGPAKGTLVPLAAASVAHPDEVLVCYAVKLATATLPQLGCGPVDPKSKGTKIEDKPPKGHFHSGVFVND